MLLGSVYPIVFLIIWSVFGIFFALLMLRLIFNYSDPNPFGKVGRFGFRIRKLTEKWVYPAARFFAMYRIDTRLAPLLTLFVGLVITYFFTQIVANTLFILNGLSEGVATGKPKAVIGFILYGLLSLLVLFIFLRFLASWFVFARGTFLAFVMKVTNPIMLPVQRLIPPIGMFDISAMVVLFGIHLLQSVVMNVFVNG